VAIEDESKGSKEAGMWNLLKKSDEQCRKVRDLLEDSAAARPEAVSIQELSEALSAAAQTHIGACVGCQEAAQDLLATREIFKGVASKLGDREAVVCNSRDVSDCGSREGIVPSGKHVAGCAAVRFAPGPGFRRPPPSSKYMAL